MKRRELLFFICYFLFSVGHADTHKPWTFWYWMYGAVSESGIRADLQAMKEVGLGGCYLMPIRGIDEKPEYEGTAQQLTPQFWKMVDYAMLQADSLGLSLGIHVCDGFALAGGPWIKPEESMQRVVWSDTLVVVGDNGLVSLPRPAVTDAYYEDIAAFAVPAYQELPAPKVSGTIVRDTNGVFRSKEPGFIQYDFDEPQAVRSLHIVPSGNNLQAQRLLVQASDDGVNYRTIRQLVPPRQGWQNTDEHYTYALPLTTARHFRFGWTPEGTEPGSEDLDAAKWSPVLKIKGLTLSSEPRIDQYESKNGSVWRIAADSASTYLPKAFESVRLRVADGKAWFPDVSTGGGQVRILRFGHTTTGHTNATAGGGRGLECDKFSASAVEKQITHWFGAFKKRPHADVVKYMHVDSWECGSQNWSHHFAEEFLKRRGYDLLPFIPVYAGYPVSNYNQVLRDIRLTINDLLQDVFFTTVARCAQAFGVQLSAESVAPTMVSDGMQHYKHVDLPMGEFWLNSPTHDKPNDMLDAISGAHIYGKNIVQAEGFTEVRGVWDETPADIKALLDRNFALGMNRLFFHVNTHNPWLDRKPGMTLDGIGLFFQRDQIWFPEAKAFVDYITRCQRLLQMGRPVVDIAVFTGEEMPRRAFTPDRLVPMLPGLFGPARVASERERLANHGVPMTESPVGVRHTAGILDLKDWINPLHGYQYDSMNKDALLTQPFGYKVLVVPSWVLVSAEVRERIAELRRQGVLVIDEPYADSSFKTVSPDAVLPEGIAYTHRTGDGFDFYFLSNQTSQQQTFSPVFRHQRGEAVVYNPLTDENTTFDGTLSLPPYGSAFVCYGPTRATRNDTEGLSRCAIGGLWDITFRESGVTLTGQPLFDWSQHADDRIRYFSGHARYTTTLTLKKSVVSQGRAWLTFPNVKDIAHVWVNGHDCGIAWTAPYELEITQALRKGKNKIEIEVVNTWHNALRGADQGRAPYDGIWTNAKYRTKGDGLLPAGLLAPPELIIKK